MKKYVAPTIEYIELTERMSICVVSELPKKRYATWGSDEKYGTKGWINQGYGEHDTEIPVLIEDDNGELNSMSKGFNAWEDWE